METIVEHDIPDNKWDDPEFVAEMDRRVNALEDGTDKGYTREEVKQRVWDRLTASNVSSIVSSGSDPNMNPK